MRAITRYGEQLRRPTSKATLSRSHPSAQTRGLRCCQICMFKWCSWQCRNIPAAQMKPTNEAASTMFIDGQRWRVPCPSSVTFSSHAWVTRTAWRVACFRVYFPERLR
jgi:hypothetical protein